MGRQTRKAAVPPLYQQIGARLTALRRYVGQTPTEFARRLCIDHAAYEAMERGTYPPGEMWTETVVVAGALTGCSLDWILTGEIGEGMRDDAYPKFRPGRFQPPSLRTVR